jgi:hypothetical protein
MNFFSVGRPATDGKGPERYSVRFALWIPSNATLNGIEHLSENQSIAATVAGRNATLEKRHDFVIFRITGVESYAAAQALANQVATGLIRFSAQKGMAIQFSFPPSEIVRDRDQLFDFRERLEPTNYPSDWIVRADGTRTDGGIFAHQTCILAEHERIWEYPAYFGKIIRPFNLQEVGTVIEESSRFASSAMNNAVLCGVRALWAACAQDDRRLTYILLVTALDVLAEDENVKNWADDLKDVIEAMNDAIAKHSGDQDKLIEKLSRKVDEIGRPGMADRVRSLVLRAFGIQERNSPEAQKLVSEINKVLGKRGSLAHGGKFLEAPTADENERLRVIVATALNTKLTDSGVP